jgi:hypothetical protein
MRHSIGSFTGIGIASMCSGTIFLEKEIQTAGKAGKAAKIVII